MTDQLNDPLPAFDVDSALNECMDLEAAGRPDELRALIRKATASDPSFEARLLKMRATMGQLRGMPDSPNMAPEILTEVDYLRPFLSPRRRRQVSATRVAVGAAAVITLSFMAVMQRLYPQATSLTTQPTPIGAVVRASGADAADSVKSIVSAVGAMRMEVSKPAPVGRPHRWNGPIWSGSDSSLVMGDTSRYEAGTELTLGPVYQGGGLLNTQAMERGIDLAQTGWTQSPVRLSLSASTGLLQQPSPASIILGVEPGGALLNLADDAPFGPSWLHRSIPNQFPRGAGLAQSTKDSANK